MFYFFFQNYFLQLFGCLATDWHGIPVPCHVGVPFVRGSRNHLRGGLITIYRLRDFNLKLFNSNSIIYIDYYINRLLLIN